MAYILGYRPDKFGLLPDAQGYIACKELLKAIHEEPDFSYVSQAHINEVLLGKDRNQFHLEAKQIKAIERHWHLDFDAPVPIPPRILFTPIRRKAHPIVMEKGLNAPQSKKFLILSANKEMAIRIGKRRDQKPVLLEIKAADSSDKGGKIFRFGDFYLTSHISARFISGPFVAKEILKARSDLEAKKTIVEHQSRDLAPGSFILDNSSDHDLCQKAKGKKRKGWKEASRKIRRYKKS